MGDSWMQHHKGTCAQDRNKANPVTVNSEDFDIQRHVNWFLISCRYQQEHGPAVSYMPIEEKSFASLLYTATCWRSRDILLLEQDNVM